MQKEYVAPELKLAGEADAVVFGGGSGGFDYGAEMIYDLPPYQDDETNAGELTR